MSCFVIGEGEAGFELSGRPDGLPQIDEDVSAGALFLRALGLTVTHDFDRMTDRLRIHSRSAPWDSLQRSGVTFDKRVVYVDLPPRGTEKREGFDLALSAISVFLRDHGENS